MGLEGKPGVQRRTGCMPSLCRISTRCEKKVVNAKEVIRFDIESLSATIAIHQTPRQLRNLAGGFAAHHDAQS